MWQVCQKHTRKEILVCMSDRVKAKAKASVNKAREHAVFVLMFANCL